MRTFGASTAVLVILCGGLAACDEPAKVETSKLEKSFATAPPASKSAMEDLKTAVAAGDYAKAAAALEKLASNANLTAEQKKAIEDAAVQMKDALVQTAKGVAKDAMKEGEKALEDVRKQLTR